MNPANKVIINTFTLYVRLLLVMVIGLFTTRLILAALGEVDFGIYALVAGVAGMLAFLQTAMSAASMRFIAHGLGTGRSDYLLKTFNTTLFLHFALGFLLLIIMELGGLIMFKYYLNIPEARIYDAKIVFHFLVITTFITVISVPYDAVMNSHENMFALSIVDLLGQILRLGVAIYLTHSHANLLIMYGLLLLIIQIILRIIKQWYSIRKYPECKIDFALNVDKSLINSILSFSSWSLLGAIAYISVTQVKSVLLNMFFGVRLNAANGIAMTVTGQVNTFSNSMTQAIRPQLLKSEGSGDRKKMLRMTGIATKFSIFLFALFAIPVIIELPYLLALWLTEVPEYTVVFCRLILIGLFIDKFSFEIGTAIGAVGDIKAASIAETGLLLLALLISYIAFKLRFPPQSIFVVNILIISFIFLVKLNFGKRIANLDVGDFIKSALIPSIIPIILSFLVALVPPLFMKESIVRVLITCFLSLTTLVIMFRYIGLTQSEFLKIESLVKSGFNKINDFKLGKKHKLI
jgi:O-antigen/teichoic acid export membrane protein